VPFGFLFCKVDIKFIAPSGRKQSSILAREGQRAAGKSNIFLRQYIVARTLWLGESSCIMSSAGQYKYTDYPLAIGLALSLWLGNGFARWDWGRLRWGRCL